MLVPLQQNPCVPPIAFSCQHTPAIAIPWAVDCWAYSQLDSIPAHPDNLPSVKPSSHISVVLRPYRNQDKEAVFEVLSFLPLLYPKGHEWLEKRLGEVVHQSAECTLAICDSRLAGLTIETPKGLHVRKLSTIWVAPDFRSLGLGSRLLEACRRKWNKMEIRFAYVTADANVSLMLWPLLRNHGFRLLNTEMNRYGEGRNECIFDWNPEQPTG